MTARKVAHDELDIWLEDGKPIYFQGQREVLDLGHKFKQILEDAKRSIVPKKKLDIIEKYERAELARLRKKYEK